MSTYLQIAASNVTQKAKFEDGTRLPIELWAICEEDADASCLAGIVLHPATKELVRADQLPGFVSYQSDRYGSGFSRLNRPPHPRHAGRQKPRNDTLGKASAQRPLVVQAGNKLAKKSILPKSA